MRFGLTYSHIEIARLKLDHQQSLQQVLELHLDLIRLGIYWDELQPTAKDWQVAAMHQLLRQCQDYHQEVVISVGMKAPRHPEYYPPSWVPSQSLEEVRPHCLTFIERAVNEFKHYSCITTWQVENEPLDHNGPHNWRIPESMLEQEIALIRQLDPNRPIHLNAWGDDIIHRDDIQHVSGLVDSLGFDLYYQQPAGAGKYHGPKVRDWRLRWWIGRQSKPIWITELQAEPWEANDELKFSAQPPGINPEMVIKNLDRAVKLQPEIILLWGCEYWLWQKSQDRPEWWEAAVEAFRRYK